jgi:hypothetical protein
VAALMSNIDVAVGIIRGLLRLGGRVHQHGRVMAQDLHPALEVGGIVGEGGVRDAAVG